MVYVLRSLVYSFLLSLVSRDTFKGSSVVSRVCAVDFFCGFDHEKIIAAAIIRAATGSKRLSNQPASLMVSPISQKMTITAAMIIIRRVHTLFIYLVYYIVVR